MLGLPDLRHGNDERRIVAAATSRKAPELAFPQFRGPLGLLPGWTRTNNIIVGPWWTQVDSIGL